MSKKNSIIIILLAFALIIGSLIYFYFSSGTTPTGNVETTTPEQGNIFGGGGNNQTGGTSPTTEEQGQAGGQAKQTEKLAQIYRSPTSGAVFFTNKNNQNILRFAARNNGNIYEYLPESQTGEPIRITNTTIPKVQETVWSKASDNLVLRYLDSETDDIISFSAKIIAGSSTGNIDDMAGTLTGTFMSPNIEQLVANPKGDKIFGLSEKLNGSGSYGVVYSFTDTSKKQIFDSPITFWEISWPRENIITFTTKPSYLDPGFLYFFNTQTNSMDRVLGDFVGMSSLTNGDANLVAYSKGEEGSFRLDVYNVKSKTNQYFKIPTLSDKCVWGLKNIEILYCAVPQNIPAGLYPDDWYQGLISFSDNIWMIDTKTGTTKEIYQVGSNETASIDAFDLRISGNDEYLTFSNKNDLSLWLLKIND